MPESSTSSWRAFSPLDIRLRPAKQLRWLVAGVHLLAATAIFVSGLPFFTDLVLALLVALSLWSAWLELEPGRSVRGLIWAVDKRTLLLVDSAMNVISVDNILSSAVIPGMLVLKLLRSDRALPTWLIVTPDMCTRDEWRRLRLAIQLAPPLQREASGQG